MRIRTLFAMFAATGAIVSGFAVPASAASQVCTLTMNTLTARDLQEERGDGDEIRLEIGDTKYPLSGYVKYDREETHTAGAFDDPAESFVSSVGVRVIEVDAPLPNDTIGNPLTESCRVGSHTHTFSGDGGIYDLTYTIAV